MPGSIAANLIIQIQADVNRAISDLQRVDKTLNSVGSSAVDMQKSFKKQISNIGATYSVFGKQNEGLAEKFELVKQRMMGLNRETKEGQREFQILSRYGNGIQKAMGSASKSVQGLTNSTVSLKEIGLQQLDRITGGVSTKIMEMASSIGVTEGVAYAAGGALAALVVVWKEAMIPGIKFNMMLEQEATAFKVMLGSAQNAAKMMGELKTLSLTTPIGLGEGASGTKQLLAYGFKQQEIITNLKMMSTVAKAVNVPLQDVVYVYGTLRAQGRAYTRDLMQFAMRGIPIYEYLAKVMNVSVGEIKALTEEGKVGFKEVEAALVSMTSKGGKFFGLLEESMKTTQGSITVLKNTWQIMTGELASAMMPVFKDFLANLIYTVKNLSGLFVIIGGYMALFMKVVNEIAKGWLINLNLINLVAEVFVFLAVMFKRFIIDSDFVKGIWEGIKQLFDFILTIVEKILGTNGKLKDSITKVGEGFKTWLDPLTKVNQSINWMIEKLKKLRGEQEGGEQSEYYKKYMPGLRTGGGRNTPVKETALGETLLSQARAVEDEWKNRIDSTGNEIAAKAADLQRKMLADDVALKKLTEANMEASYETALAILSNTIDIQKEEYDRALEDASKYAVDFYAVFKRNVDPSVMKRYFSQGTDAANDYLVKFDLMINETRTRSKLFGESQEEAAKSMSDTATKIVEDLENIIYTMDKLPTFNEKQGLVMKETMLAYLRNVDSMIIETKKKGKDFGKELDSLIEKYMEFRTKVSLQESGDLIKRLQVSSDRDPLTRQIENIKKKWEDYYREMMKAASEQGKQLSATDMEMIERMKMFEIFTAQNEAAIKVYKLQKDATEDLREKYNITLMQAVSEQAMAKKTMSTVDYELWKRGQILKVRKEEIAVINSEIDKEIAWWEHKSSMAEGFYGLQLAYANLSYRAEVERINTTMKGEEAIIALQKAKLKLKEDEFAIAEKQMKLLQEGSEEYWKQNAKDTMDAYARVQSTGSGSMFGDIKDIFNFKKIFSLKGGIDFTSIFSVPMNDAIAGFAKGATQGTNVGGLMAKNVNGFGGDPIIMFLTSLAKMVTSIENVNKVLNFFDTIMEGLKSIIEGPLNKALEPLVKLLNVNGQILGALILPTIEVLGEVLDAFVSPFVFFAEIIKQLLLALKPLLKLFIYIMNPLALVLRGLTQSLALLGNAVQLESDRQKALEDLYEKELASLQELYNVGAISGAKYKEMLAGLKRPGEEDGKAGPNPMQETFNKILAGIKVIADWATAFYDSVVTPIVDGIQTLMGKIFSPIIYAFKSVFTEDRMAALEKTFTAISDGVGKFVTSVVDTIVSLYDLFSPIIDPILQFVGNVIFETIFTALSGILDVLQIVSGALATITSVVNLISGVINWLKGFFTGDSAMQAAALQQMIDALNGIWEGIMTIVRGIGNIFIDAINWLIGVFEGIGDILNGAFGRPSYGRIPRLATGTGYVPEDMLANIHQGEMVVPSSFADAIRSGDVAMVSGRGGSGGVQVVNIYVAGSVIAERELMQKVSYETKKLSRQGYSR